MLNQLVTKALQLINIGGGGLLDGIRVFFQFWYKITIWLKQNMKGSQVEAKNSHLRFSKSILT